MVQKQYRQIGLAFKMYSNEAKGYLYPPIIKTDAGWIMDIEKLYFSYLNYPKHLDGLDLVDPAFGNEGKAIIARELAKEKIDWDYINETAAQNLVYTGLYFSDHKVVQEVVERANSLDKIDKYIVIGNSDRQVVNHTMTSTDINGGFLLKDEIMGGCFGGLHINEPTGPAMPQSATPTIIQRRIDPYGGFHVLFMDGHVEYMKADEATDLIKALRSAHGMDVST